MGSAVLGSIYLACIMQNDCWRLGSILHNGWSYFYSMVSVGLFKIILCLGIACSFPPFAGIVCTWRAILNFGEPSRLLDNCFQVQQYPITTRIWTPFWQKLVGVVNSCLWLRCGCMLLVRWWNIVCCVVLGFVLTFLMPSLSFTHFAKHLNYMHMANYTSVKFGVQTHLVT
jgi:hypothetical protein